ncbi:PREDICTED: uncharacterized protein LOC106814632 [Priapulus caudatus]|uniref:Uncharacterized protein LOC106814632 n=1 Tax=Priapulus caudatus TaxID=37621 RepID=A0ABM1EQI5_PRICU|nr:PREDICTED: uncharacterized protein LOC106814632 [Priapulus caudatus]
MRRATERNGVVVGWLLAFVVLLHTVSAQFYTKSGEGNLPRIGRRSDTFSLTDDAAPTFHSSYGAAQRHRFNDKLAGVIDRRGDIARVLTYLRRLENGNSDSF